MQSIIGLLGVICFSCVETFDFESELGTFESILVIEATITNELKKQEILLLRTFKLGEDGPSPESGAKVKVVDDANNEYVFRESDSAGIYISTIAFAAKRRFVYTLQIATNNGKEYSSTSMQLPNETTIDNLYAIRDFNEDGEEGVSIYVDSYDATGNSQYYRYEYEEAYKIISPKWISEDLKCIETEFGVEFVFQPRPVGELLCFNVVKSKDILITNTLDLMEDRLDQHRVLFLNRNNYIISHRYSIEVKQYIQSREAYVYYETLKEMSQSESLLSENQPGFIVGNISSVAQQSEKVVGFFEVTAVDTKRIYFNYKDLFPGELLPPHATGCEPFSPRPEGLCDALKQGKKFWELFPNHHPVFESFVFLVPGECGDCTTLGETEKPEFWID